MITLAVAGIGEGDILSAGHSVSDFPSTSLSQPIKTHFLSDLTSSQCPAFILWQHRGVCHTPTPPTMVQTGYSALWKETRLPAARMQNFYQKDACCCLATCFWNKLLQSDKLSWVSPVLFESVCIDNTLKLERLKKGVVLLHKGWFNSPLKKKGKWIPACSITPFITGMPFPIISTWYQEMPIR